jgi:hypothetical protein
MISAETLAEVELRKWQYILGVRMRSSTEAKAVVASLREALGHGDKSLVGNKGYRKYLRAGGQQFAVDEDKIQEEARYDGKWVLTTNTDLPTHEVALKYKQLWMVEDVVRDLDNPNEMKTAINDKSFVFRGQTSGVAGKVFQARGIALPPVPRSCRICVRFGSGGEKACHYTIIKTLSH